jgi:hypothetical protein
MLAKADTFVDLGPGTVTMVFGRDEEKVEEKCHTFPLAAHSQVFGKMLMVDMLEKASGRVELPHISPATGRLCSGSPLLVLWIWDVYPGSRILIITPRIPVLGSRIQKQIKERGEKLVVIPFL